MLTTILATALVLGVLILVHELGHFWVAKAVDIEVSRFSIGFGPKIVGFRRGETEYVLSAFPLGGYVKMEGMADEEVTSKLEGPSEAPARRPSPRDFDAKPLWARFLVISAGVAMNILFAFVAFSFIARAQGVYEPVVTGVVIGSPADSAGIQVGDRILAVDGRRVSEASELVRAIFPRIGKPTQIELERGDRVHSITVIPGEAREWDPLVRDSVSAGRIGVLLEENEESLRSLNLAEALAAGGSQTASWVREIYEFFVRLVTGERSARELGGPIAIGQLSGMAARAGFWSLLNFMAIISVNLAVLNLLPIPVLDGGHLAFLAIEALRGKAVSVEQRLRFTQIGMLFVLGLMVWAFANDILRIVGA
jgi:regulator of sigma E protease